MKNTKIETTTLNDVKAKSSDVVERSKLLAKKLEAQVSTKKSVEKKKEKNAEVKAKTVVVKDVKDFISVKTQDELQLDKRAVVKQRRYYMMNEVADDKFEVFNKTMYVDANNNRQVLTQALARTFVQQYIQKVKLKTQFSAQDIMHIHKTCGGAFGDLIRNALYETSLYVNTTKDAENKDIIAKALSLKKNCIYFNVNEQESQRKRYNFIKIQ